VHQHDAKAITAVAPLLVLVPQLLLPLLSEPSHAATAIKGQCATATATTADASTAITTSASKRVTPLLLLAPLLLLLLQLLMILYC
jgi:hypothetical protein